MTIERRGKVRLLESLFALGGWRQLRALAGLSSDVEIKRALDGTAGLVVLRKLALATGYSVAELRDRTPVDDGGLGTLVLDRMSGKRHREGMDEQ